MRLRALDANGDYTFGNSGANFLVNTPQLVAQSVQTRLLLMEGEWFLDTTDGTPYSTQILGARTKALYDIAIQTRVLQTPGVNTITEYESTLTGRALSVSLTISTIFGQTEVTAVF